MPGERVVLEPDAGRLIEGLRDTGYTTNTALADIVDNSVDAGATQIDVQIAMDPTGAIVVSVCDNGCGMDKDGLLNGMKYGSPAQPDPSRLGKFGMGLKTASTSQCKRFSVVTRSSNGEIPLVATWDLNHVVASGKWELFLEEADAEDRDLLENTAGTGTGTAVIWRECDRILSKQYQAPGGAHAQRALNKCIEAFHAHVALVYGRFIDPTDDRATNATITVCGEVVKSDDPFCKGEPQTEKMLDEEIPVELEVAYTDEDGKTEVRTETGTMTLRGYVLPHKDSFSSEEVKKRADVGPDRQGVYVYRENRLINQPGWLGIWKKETHFHLARVEMSVDHDLDRMIKLDMKKSQVILPPELSAGLEGLIKHTRDAANDRSRKRLRRDVEDRAQNAHANSNANIRSKENRVLESEVTDVNAADGEVTVRNESGTSVINITVGTASENGQIHVCTVGSLDDGHLWEPALVDSHHAVNINTGHPYYGKVYVPNLGKNVSVEGMDSLLWALAEAELGTVTEDTKRYFRELRFKVAKILRHLVEDLPDPDFDGDGDSD